VKERTKKLEKYLRSILHRLPPTRDAAARDPACDLLREFLLLRVLSGSGRHASDPMQKVRVASEAFSAQNATGHHGMTDEAWRNPLESQQAMNKKFLALTGQTVTELLNEELFKVVQNDSRRNGITSQISTFVQTIQTEYKKGSLRESVERMMVRNFS
jgi:hypothetical protein